MDDRKLRNFIPFWSARCQRAAELCAWGKTNYEIADIMGTTYGMVERYFTAIYATIGVPNRVILALWMHKIVDLEIPLREALAPYASRKRNHRRLTRRK